MKRILCYGDSNTWGAVPDAAGRFDETKRWTSLLARDLGSGYSVVEQGLCGRTTVFDDPNTPYRNGRDLIIPILRTHKPLDLVILMLGTNDLKPGLAKNAADVARGIEELVKIILDPAAMEDGPVPEILVVSPVEVGETIERSRYGVGFGGRDAIQMSKEVAPLARDVAARYGCHFIDAARVTPPSVGDAIHLDAKGHELLASALAQKVRSAFGA